LEEELLVAGAAGVETRLYVRRFVPAAVAKGGPAVLLLHGSESHAAWFDQLCERLAASGVSTYAFDRAGWGRSGGARGVLASPASALAEVEAARRHVATDHARVHLVGLSWGGLLAAAAREAAPAAWASVTLVSPALFPRRRPRPKVVWSIVKALLVGDKDRLAPLPIAPEDFAFAPDVVDRVRADALRTQAASAGFWAATVLLLGRARRSFHRGKSPPTQVLLAEHDPLIDTDRTRALATARGAAVTTFPGTRHSLVLEDPARVAALILAVAARGHEGAA
jgi:alpha-beta hydrolase superfamily lysophospholipase